MRYWVWVPDEMDRPDETNVERFAIYPDSAAEMWVHRNWERLDHPSELFVRVDDEEGHRFEFMVTAEPSTVFRARAVG